MNSAPAVRYAPGWGARIRRPGPAMRRWRREPAPAILLAAMAGALAGALAVEAPVPARTAAGLAVMGSYFLVAIRTRKLALALVVVWLIFMGLVRRALIPFLGWPGLDPLLLLGPVCAVILWITSRQRGARTLLATLILLQLALVAAQVFNPLVEDVVSGILATLFWVGPLLWFFVGRTLTPSQLERVFGVVTIALVPVVAHGLIQSFGVFFPLEFTWVGVSGFGEAIFMQNFRIRPFSTLTSPQEYGFFLSFGAAVLWSRILTERRRRVPRLLLLAPTVVALFLQASRGIFLFFALMLIVTMLLWTRASATRLIGLSSVAFLVVVATFHTARPGQSPPTRLDPGTSSLETLARHQIAGFSNPQSSTLPVHAELIAEAFRAALERPFGSGLSEGTIARTKIGDERMPGPENDIATVFLALGIPAGLLFLGFIAAAFREALRRLRTHPGALSLGTVGILIAFLTQWWTGAMYTASALLWLVLGGLAGAGHPRASHPGRYEPLKSEEGRRGT
ncbi:MAG: O-antigen ligase family protein [Actinomycetota bacterium]